jgi:hypothetical protein
VKAYLRGPGQQFAATEAPLDRNGLPLAPSTLADPCLSDFLISISSIHRNTPPPDPFSSHAEQIPHDEICSFCVYYDIQDRFSSIRPIRNSFNQCNLRTNSQAVCQAPSLFFCDMCLHMVCRGCQNFFSDARDRAELLQHSWTPTTRPPTLRKLYATHTGPVHPHSFFDTPIPLVLPHRTTIPPLGTSEYPISVSSDDEQTQQPAVLLPQRRRRPIPTRTSPGTAHLHPAPYTPPNTQSSSTPSSAEFRSQNLCTSLASLSVLLHGLPQGNPLPTWLYAATRDSFHSVSPRHNLSDDDEPLTPPG